MFGVSFLESLLVYLFAYSKFENGHYKLYILKNSKYELK